MYGICERLRVKFPGPTRHERRPGAEQIWSASPPIPEIQIEVGIATSQTSQDLIDYAGSSNQSTGQASMLGVTVGCADETERSANLIDLDQRKTR